jgi:large conductance mechanosensitive channel
MAVGVIIGGAFGKIVTSLVNDVIMPVVTLLTGGVNFSDKSVLLNQVEEADGTITDVTLNWGMFVQSVVDFLIIALCIFCAIKAINKLKREKPEEAPAEPAPAEPTKEETLLTEIRDLLKEQNKK